MSTDVYALPRVDYAEKGTRKVIDADTLQFTWVDGPVNGVNGGS